MNYQSTKHVLDRAANPIELLARKVQALPLDVRWLYANEEITRAAACSENVIRGPRMRVLRDAIFVLSHVGLGWAGARAISLCLLTATYVRQLATKVGGPVPPAIFIGVGALRESALVKELESDGSQRFLVLHEAETAGFTRIRRLRARELRDAWRAAAGPVRAFLKSGSDTLVPRLDLVVEFAASAHLYAFFRAWFGKSLARVPESAFPIVFSTPGLPAFAAVSLGTRASYHLHGFQRQSLVYPDFDHVRCFTEVEAHHLRSRLPNAAIRVVEEVAEPVATEPVAAIAGCYGQTLGFDACSDFIAWAKDHRIPVVIRRHPRDRTVFFDSWKSDPNVTFADTASTFDEFLEHYRPRLLLSWYSTALFDALRRGVVPVTVQTEEWRSLDTVFPFREISLRWPQDRELVQRVMSDEAERSALLVEKKAVTGIGAQ